jgi:pyridoxal phosphate enzyme (YggS family)
MATSLPRSVNAGLPGLKGRIEAVRGGIAEAATRSGRDPGTVRLIAVVKNVPSEIVREAVTLGLEDLGENRVQEAEGKIAAVGRLAARWHMVGHLQRNKAGRAMELFDRVHSVDDEALAAALSKRAVAQGRRLPVLAEVNVSGEASKHGVAPSGLEPLLAAMARLPGLALDGLMTVGRPVERPEDARAEFARLRELRDRGEKALGIALPELSMGMSGDFGVAVEEGATMVRVGTALFGPRT